MILGRDLSNFTVSPPPIDAWKAAGVGWVAIQAVDPPSPYPATQTVAQIDACLAAGLVVDAYVWLWFDLDAADIAAKLALLSGYTGGQIRQLWLDVEDRAAGNYDQATTEAKISAALALCDAFPTGGGRRTGVYAGRWWWGDPQLGGNTTVFSDRRLWDANYDGAADAASGFVPYGGWDHAAIKQYAGSQPDGTDLDVLSEAEAAGLGVSQSDAGTLENTGPSSNPDDPCAELTAQRDGLVVTVADIADRLGDLLLIEADRVKQPMRRWVIRGIVAQMQAERTAAVGPRTV